jgi:hypothetical protein
LGAFPLGDLAQTLEQATRGGDHAATTAPLAALVAELNQQAVALRVLGSTP